jgi:hypothetical protein
VTVLFRPTDTGPDEILRGAQDFARVGVSTLVTSAVGDDPAGWLESTFGPVQSELREIEPARL